MRSLVHTVLHSRTELVTELFYVLSTDLTKFVCFRYTFRYLFIIFNVNKQFVVRMKLLA